MIVTGATLPRFLSMQGSVCLAGSATRRGMFRETPKPLALLHETINIMEAGRFPEGQTEIPFEAEVRGIDGMVRARSLRQRVLSPELPQ